MWPSVCNFFMLILTKYKWLHKEWESLFVGNFYVIKKWESLFLTLNVTMSSFWNYRAHVGSQKNENRYLFWLRILSIHHCCTLLYTFPARFFMRVILQHTAHRRKHGSEATHKWDKYQYKTAETGVTMGTHSWYNTRHVAWHYYVNGDAIAQQWRAPIPSIQNVWKDVQAAT